MSDAGAMGQQQKAFWNSEATRRWVTEQASIDRLMANAAEAAEFAMFIGQGARLLHGVPDAVRDAARTALQAFLKPGEGPDGVRLSAGLWLVSGHA